MRKTIPLVGFIFLFFLLPGVSAHFPEAHIYATIETFRDSNTPITNLCQGREAQMILGNMGADAPVVHYYESEDKLLSYKGTHSISLYNRCLQLAGSDIDLKCMCYGMGNHMIQDHNSHYEFVPENIRKYFASNFLIHPIAERGMVRKLLEAVENGDMGEHITRQELEALARNSYDLFFQDQKYINLFNDASGLDLTADFAISGEALRGERWDNEVWGKKVQLPNFYWVLSYGLAIIGLGGIIMVFWIGRNNWKYLAALVMFAIMGVGILLLASLYTGNSWIWFNQIADVGSRFINPGDIEPHMEKIVSETKLFWSNEQVPYVDAGGLGHTDPVTGELVEGELLKAESGFKFVVAPIIFILLTGGLIWLFLRMSRRN